MNNPHLTDPKRMFPAAVAGFNQFQSTAQAHAGTAVVDAPERQIRLEKPGETRQVVQRLIKFLKEN